MNVQRCLNFVKNNNSLYINWHTAPEYTTQRMMRIQNVLNICCEAGESGDEIKDVPQQQTNIVWNRTATPECTQTAAPVTAPGQAAPAGQTDTADTVNRRTNSRRTGKQTDRHSNFVRISTKSIARFYKSRFLPIASRNHGSLSSNFSRITSKSEHCFMISRSVGRAIKILETTMKYYAVRRGRECGIYRSW